MTELRIEYQGYLLYRIVMCIPFIIKAVIMILNSLVTGNKIEVIEVIEND